MVHSRCTRMHAKLQCTKCGNIVCSLWRGTKVAPCRTIPSRLGIRPRRSRSRCTISVLTSAPDIRQRAREASAQGILLNPVLRAAFHLDMLISIHTSTVLDSREWEPANVGNFVSNRGLPGRWSGRPTPFLIACTCAHVLSSGRAGRLG